MKNNFPIATAPTNLKYFGKVETSQRTSNQRHFRQNDTKLGQYSNINNINDYYSLRIIRK